MKTALKKIEKQINQRAKTFEKIEVRLLQPDETMPETTKHKTIFITLDTD